VKSYINVWFKEFIKKEVPGNVNLYTFKNSKSLGGDLMELNMVGNE
jgi:hypothetical protein